MIRCLVVFLFGGNPRIKTPLNPLCDPLRVGRACALRERGTLRAANRYLEKVLHLSGRVTRPVGKPQERTFRSLDSLNPRGTLRAANRYLEKVLHLSGRVTRPVGKPQERTFRYLEKVLHLSGRVTRPVGKPQEHWAGYPPISTFRCQLLTVNCQLFKYHAENCRCRL